MFPTSMDGSHSPIAFVLLPDFSMNSFSMAVEALRVANKVARKKLYDCRVFSLDGQSVAASNELKVESHGNLNVAANYPTILLCGGHEIHAFDDTQLLNWLRQMGRRNKVMGAIYTASYYLAAAGLMDGCRCAVHWEYLCAFNETFADIETSNELFETGGKRLTCVGGTASLDMMLNILAEEQGFDLARMVADQFVHERIRDRREFQYFGLSSRYAVQDERMIRVIQAMEEHLEEPLNLDEVAGASRVSRRQLERMFAKQFNKSPARYYMELRLYRSRQLIMQTKMRIIEIAIACGFNSSAHFSRSYRNFFGCTPLSERRLPEQKTFCKEPLEGA